jgi:hypothetical protein
MAANLGLHPGRFPAFVLQAVINDQVFPYQQGRPISADTIEPFVLEILNGHGKAGPQEPYRPGDRVVGGERAGKGESTGGSSHEEL